MLSYQPNSFISGPVTINDTLSTGQSYVPGSIIAPPGWNWTLPPYSVGNQEVYSNPGIGPGNSFTINVPVGYVGAPASGPGVGDGSLPIPVGGRVYGIFHHASQYFGNAMEPSKIMCWNLAALSTCLAAPGTGAWPRSTDSVGTGLPAGVTLATPTMVHHAVIAGKIYFPAVAISGTPPSPATITSMRPGIGCWDTAMEAPCPFIPLLPAGPVWTGQPSNTSGTAVNQLIAGVKTDSNGNLFMFAGDATNFPTAPTSGHVYCMTPSGSACPGWSATSLNLPAPTPSGGSDDMMLEEMLLPSLTPTRLYVNVGGEVSCLRINGSNNGSPCWTPTSVPALSSPAQAVALSPVLNSSGMVGVCLHSDRYTGSHIPACMNAVTGANFPLPSWPVLSDFMNTASNQFVVISPFHIPNTLKVLYPFYNSGDSLCWDFQPGQSCTPAAYTPQWPLMTYQNYGYAVDPYNPQSCLLGLGDGGIIWRFGLDGKYGANGACTSVITQSFDINGLFCATKPTQATWNSITIVGAPPQLTGGTYRLSFGGGPFGAAIPVTFPTTTFSSPYPATGAGSQLTVQFTPTYTGTPTQGYQLQINYSTNAQPQICYKATAGCGPVNNLATMAGPLDGPGGPPTRTSAQVDLGIASGRQCVSGSLLKICKVAGPGMSVGQIFNFAAGNATVSVPAGPPPGGMCAVGPSVSVGSVVSVTETIPTGVQVSNIDVQPPSALAGAPNLATGSVSLTLGSGVTETTYTDAVSGYLEICKAPGAGGNFSFTVNPGNRGPFVVPAGACSPPIQVPSGQVTIQEGPHPGFAMAACSAFPASNQGPCNLAAQTSTVTVAPGGISAQTVETITNRCLVPAVCPIAGRQRSPP